jgi:1-acyl-sn-glycerol-3-phosphate acyltransferase
MPDRFTSSTMAGMRWVAQRGILRPLVWRLATVTVAGTDRLDGLDAPYIAIANHSSHLDAPLVIGALPKRLSRYLAAGAAADYFFDVKWRKWLTALFFNAFPVERGASRTRVGVSKSLLDRGVPLLIFPEGSRSKTGEMGRFKPGAASLSISAGVPCVPIALVGASSAMPRGVNWPLKGRLPVCVVFGEPMRQHDGETAEDFSNRIAQAVRRLHDSVLPTGEPVTAQKGRK